MDPTHTSPLSFADLGLPAPLVDTLTEQGIVSPFPIQVATVPDALAGRDVLGRGRTGTGKTLAFTLPLVTRLAASGNRTRQSSPRGLVLVPTRELAEQVDAVVSPLARAMNLRTTTIYGGVGYGRQIKTLHDGADIVVACPGRLMDLLRSQHVHLDDIEIAILDEADHMAELGFLQDVTRLLEETPKDAQMLLFSATLDRGVDKVVRKFLVDPVTHSVEEALGDVEPISHYFFNITQNDRVPIIADLCAAPGKSLVFTRTKHGARKLAAALVQAGVPSVELHGDLSQAVRARNLSAFSDGKADTLVATDIAARGIHVDDITLVIHADPPEEHKAFLHRSGRTARAGAEGTVITMVGENMRRKVKRLAQDAGIDPIHKNVAPGDEILGEIAPGPRSFKEMPNLEVRTQRPGGPGRRQGQHRNGPRGKGPRQQGSGGSEGRPYGSGKPGGYSRNSGKPGSRNGRGQGDDRGRSGGPSGSRRDTRSAEGSRGPRRSSVGR